MNWCLPHWCNPSQIELDENVCTWPKHGKALNARLSLVAKWSNMSKKLFVGWECLIVYLGLVSLSSWICYPFIFPFWSAVFVEGWKIDDIQFVCCSVEQAFERWTNFFHSQHLSAFFIQASMWYKSFNYWSILICDTNNNCRLERFNPSPPVATKYYLYLTFPKYCASYYEAQAYKLVLVIRCLCGKIGVLTSKCKVWPDMLPALFSYDVKCKNIFSLTKD